MGGSLLCMSGHAKRVPEASVHPGPAENHCEIFEYTHLIFTVSGCSPNKQAYTHVCAMQSR